MNNEEKILSILENLQQSISSLEKTTNEKFDTMERRFDTMEHRFDTMEGRMDQMDIRLETFEKSTTDQFDALKNRMTALEKLTIEENQMTRSELKSEIQNVYDEVKDLQGNVNDIETITAKNWKDITRLKSAR